MICGSCPVNRWVNHHNRHDPNRFERPVNVVRNKENNCYEPYELFDEIIA